MSRKRVCRKCKQKNVRIVRKGLCGTCDVQTKFAALEPRARKWGL